MLAETAYGKSGVRLVQVTRPGDRDVLRDLTVAIKFEGDYDTCYTDGDNSHVLPTDTMKNTVYALAAKERLQEPEVFGIHLAEHFLECNPRLRRVTVDMREHLWSRITVGGREHNHAFMREGPESRTAHIRLDRQEALVHAGISDLSVMKSAGSAFSGFVRDEYTTLADTRDRLLATSLTATWRYDSGTAYGPAWHAVRRTLLETFANHDSESVQHTLYAMGKTVLDEIADVADIHIVMPNRHHLPVDVSRFGVEDRHEVFVATEEPFGLIQATLRRP
ncbi:MAG TPA: urate oxidase [Vicinamibacterales bacterium]